MKKTAKKLTKHQVAQTKAKELLGSNSSVTSVLEAVNRLKELKYAKFDETLDVCINLGIDPKRTDQSVKGVVQMPSGTGKKVKVAVFCEDDLVEAAKDAGADFYNREEIIAMIEGESIKFDVLIASPTMLIKLSKHSRALGTKGLMPNPKAGTITKDVAGAVKDFKRGKTAFKSDKGGNIMCGIGKLSFSGEELSKNLHALLNEIIRLKPTTMKGKYIKRLSISSTMSPSIRLDLPGIEKL